MPDLEKVIKGMEYCIDYARRIKDKINDVPCKGCPYVGLKDKKVGDGDCIDTMIADAIALLKAREPVEYVIHCKNADLNNGAEFACGECGGSLLHKKLSYCPWCGREVKWDDD